MPADLHTLQAALGQRSADGGGESRSSSEAPRQGASPSSTELVEAAQVAQMVARMNNAPDLPTALRDLANCLQLWLGCDRVVIGLADWRGMTCRVAAVSGQSQFDRRSDAVKTLEQALDETIDCDGPVIWPREDDDAGAPLTYRGAALMFRCSAVVGAPLVGPRGRRIGAVLALGAEDLLTRTAALRRFRMHTPVLAGHVALLRQAHAGLAERLACEGLLRLRRRSFQTGLAAALLLIAALFIPIPYRLTCDCTIEPVVRRHVAAPFDGRLDVTLVKPGDVVQRGDPLARMDEKELRWELTGATAEREQARKRYDAALASRSAGAAQVALLEMQQLEAKMRMLEARREQLTIESPLDGVVTRGDLKRSEGAPLSVGQTLFEVAPLDKMVVEVEIPEDEIAQFRSGAAVAVKLDAFAGSSWSGRLDRLYPRAELRNEANVFIAEMYVVNHGDLLRPGMRGRAKVEGPWRSIGWIWLHRPWEAVRKRLHL